MVLDCLQDWLSRLPVRCGPVSAFSPTFPQPRVLGLPLVSADKPMRPLVRVLTRTAISLEGNEILGGVSAATSTRSTFDCGQVGLGSRGQTRGVPERWRGPICSLPSCIVSDFLRFSVGRPTSSATNPVYPHARRDSSVMVVRPLQTGKVRGRGIFRPLGSIFSRPGTVGSLSGPC